MSVRPMCIALLHSHAKMRMCQKPYFVWPSWGMPVQIFSWAAGQKSAREVTPRLGRAAMAPVRKMRGIQGAKTVENRETRSNP